MYPDIDKDTLRNTLWLTEFNLLNARDMVMRAQLEIIQLKAVRTYYRQLIKRFCNKEIHIHIGDEDFIFKEMLRREPFFREGTDKPLTPKRLQELIKYVEENDQTALG